MFCRNCGKPIDDNAAFCSNCGTPVNNKKQEEKKTFENPKVIFGLAPIQKKNIVTCLLLSIITCGIYAIYWLICLADDANEASRSQNGTGGGMVFLLTLITCGIYEYYWMYKVGEQLAVAKEQATGTRGENNGVLYLILSILGFGIVSYCLIQNELNQVAAYE